MRNRACPFVMTVTGLVVTVIQSLAQSVYTPYTFTTLAGNAGYGSADGTGSDARFWNPTGVAVDEGGNVYVADSWNHTIRRVTPTGAVITLAGLAGIHGSTDGTGSDARFNYPSGIALDGTGNLYVADRDNQTIRIVTPMGVVTTLAGMAGVLPGSTDGIGSAARFWNPTGVAVDSAGDVCVADSANGTIRKVTREGAVATLAGLARFGGSADGTGSEARFNSPSAVAVDRAGHVFVADQNNHTIRKVTSAGAVTTLAGLPGGLGSTDGAGTTARFWNPTGVAVDSAGNVYVADSANGTIRKVTRDGAVATLAGLAHFGGSADGTGATHVLGYPKV